MKWQIRQIPENYEDEIINGLFFITSGEPVPSDTYLCRSGEVRSTAVPIDKAFKRKVECYHNTEVRKMYTSENWSAYFSSYEECEAHLIKCGQEFYPGIYCGRLKKGKTDAEPTK